MKWMFTYASIVILPFTYKELAVLPWATIPVGTWLETAFVVFVATYLALHSDDERPKDAPPHHREHVQLRAAHRGLHCQRVATGLGVFGWSQGWPSSWCSAACGW